MDLSSNEYERGDRRRRDALDKGLNGVERVEAQSNARSVRVYFDLPPPDLGPENFSIAGGVRVTGLKVIDVQPAGAAPRGEPGRDARDRCLIVTVDRPGDFSRYVLAIDGVAGFDPHALGRPFHFRDASAGGLDCRGTPPVAPTVGTVPRIDYLAKDYASFRQLLLDRLALVLPDWKETHVSDVGVALVEILAYAGDYLSYYQDAVATEAYLGTARQRISIKRHARLVDYAVHEGCNARAWVCLKAAGEVPPLAPGDCLFITGSEAGFGDADAVLDPSMLLRVPSDSYERFVPVGNEPIVLHAALNGISFHTWGADRFVLTRGATRATLRDERIAPAPDANAQSAPTRPYEAPEPRPASARDRRALDALVAGRFLCFEEVRSPEDGTSADADASHRHIVRLTRVERTVDPVYDQPIVEIEWSSADALPFDLILARIGDAPACRYLGPARAGAAGEDLVLARGNVILVDHGGWMEDEDIDGSVPILRADQRCDGEGRLALAAAVPGIYRPRLKRRGSSIARRRGRPAPPAAA